MNRQLIILELFSGTGSFTKEATKRGHYTFDVDMNPRFNPDWATDIDNLNITDLPIEFQTPDVVWASPPCTQYSHAKRTGVRDLVGANKTVRKTLLLIHQLNPKIWILENPQTGLLKDQDFMRLLPFNDVSYCKYGYPYRKQTRIWNSLKTWAPKPTCKKDCGFVIDGRHIASAGNGRKKYTDRPVPLTQKYSIPPELCEELVIACENQV